MNPKDIAKLITEDPDILQENDPEPQLPAEQPTGVDPQQFLNFLGAALSSADQTQLPLMLQKLGSMSPEQLAAIVGKSTSIGSIGDLSRYIMAKPSRIMGIIEIAKKLFTGPELEEVVDQMVHIQEDGDMGEEGDYYLQGQDSGGH